MASDKKQVKQNEPHVDGKNEFTDQLSNDGRLSRPLGFAERVLLERERVNNWGTVTSVLLLDSKEELNQDYLRKALGLLLKRFPLLRMRINESGSEACFEEMDSPDTVDFQVLDGITADKWEEGFEKEINGALFNTATGPLWRVRLLREKFHEGKFRNAFVFTFHHVVCDAASIFELQKKLMEYLTSLHGGEEFEVESLPFRPPVESLMSDLATPNAREKMLFSSFFTLQRVKTFFAKPKNLYLSVYPPVANTNPSVAKKTCLLSRTLSEEETINKELQGKQVHSTRSHYRLHASRDHAHSPTEETRFENSSNRGFILHLQCTKGLPAKSKQRRVWCICQCKRVIYSSTLGRPR